MKKNLIGYVEPRKIIEVVAAVDQEKLEEFFNSIKDHNFEDGYVLPSVEPTNYINSGDLKCMDIQISDGRSSHANITLQTSDDIIAALKAVSEQGVVNFELFTELLESNSKLNNPVTATILSNFMELYDFEKKCVFEEHKFSSIQRAIMTFGEKKDIDDFNALASSLANNTKFLRMIGKTTLLKSFTEKINFPCSIDKNLVK